MLGNNLVRTAAAAIAAGAFALLAAVPAAASGDWPAGSGGVDISWPQCGRDLGRLPSDNFAVVGVNGGEPFTMNPCFAAQYAWMRTGGAVPSVYINTQYGETGDGYSGCAAEDHACRAYDYGYLAAQYAYTRANFLTHGASLKSSTWWLDVETQNDWSDNPGNNARVVAGAIDYLRATGHHIGVYSTPGQYRGITGGYNPGPGIGNWVAGADGLDDYTMCFHSLWAGGPVWMYQYLNLGRDLDENHSC